MDNIRKLPLRKRCIIIFSVLSCLFVSYFTIFTVSSSANSSSLPDFSSTYVSGSPVDVSGLIERVVVDDVVYLDSFILPSANTYLMSPTGVPTWVETASFSDPSNRYSFVFDYSEFGSNSADVFISSGSHFVTSLTFTCNTDIFISSVGDLPKFGLTFGLYDVVSASGTFNVTYNYNLNRAVINSDGVVGIGSSSFQTASRVSVVDDGYSLVPLFLPNFWNTNFISNYDDFYSKFTGKYYCWVDSISVTIEPSVVTSNIFLTNAYEPVHLSTWYTDQSKLLRDFFSADIASIDFDSISWTDWITNSVGSFLNFQIVPGISFSGILAFLIAMSLFMMFLKFFAGG